MGESRRFSNRAANTKTRTAQHLPPSGKGKNTRLDRTANRINPATGAASSKSRARARAGRPDPGQSKNSKTGSRPEQEQQGRIQARARAARPDPGQSKSSKTGSRPEQEQQGRIRARARAARPDPGQSKSSKTGSSAGSHRAKIRPKQKNIEKSCNAERPISPYAYLQPGRTARPEPQVSQKPSLDGGRPVCSRSQT